ncbi:hypothetical protein MSIMFB_02629 [Mycobacterium simulans]|uniref:Uncharacterized protein n=1 Tax=Mycobacterium simulans TaxID=627089 RepID=A0A7Z7IML2_9MYCO|nr:hypothetical protein MSIMFB_02629 [Mycobacterium simulans]
MCITFPFEFGGGLRLGGGDETPADARQCGNMSLSGIAGVEDLSRELRLALAKQQLVGHVSPPHLVVMVERNCALAGFRFDTHLEAV